MYKSLTIAGSDSSGGAGIQADIKTFTAHKVYGMSVVTAITAQNTCGVYAVQEIEAEIVAAQLDAVFTDIFPDSIKIGMVASTDIIQVIAQKLKEYRAQNIVLDPVMISTSGHRLLEDSAQSALINLLMPIVDIITPNISEAEVLAGFSIANKEDMIKAARTIAKRYSGNILVKGGHLINSADDLLYMEDKIFWLKQKRVLTHNTHGTGCTLSSAIASNLAMGLDVFTAVENAKRFVYKALKSDIKLGKGNGPINHCCDII